MRRGGRPEGGGLADRGAGDDRGGGRAGGDELAAGSSGGGGVAGGGHGQGGTADALGAALVLAAALGSGGGRAARGGRRARGAVGGGQLLSRHRAHAAGWRTPALNRHCRPPGRQSSACRKSPIVHPRRQYGRAMCATWAADSRRKTADRSRITSAAASSSARSPGRSQARHVLPAGFSAVSRAQGIFYIRKRI